MCRRDQKHYQRIPRLAKQRTRPQLPHKCRNRESTLRTTPCHPGTNRRPAMKFSKPAALKTYIRIYLYAQHSSGSEQPRPPNVRERSCGAVGTRLQKPCPSVVHYQTYEAPHLKSCKTRTTSPNIDTPTYERHQKSTRRHANRRRRLSDCTMSDANNSDRSSTTCEHLPPAVLSQVRTGSRYPFRVERCRDER